VLIATLHCSDPRCDAAVEIEIEALGELDGWPCDCGYGLVLVGVAELEAIDPSQANGIQDRIERIEEEAEHGQARVG
jgi:hypothetical protein